MHVEVDTAGSTGSFWTSEACFVSCLIYSTVPFSSTVRCQAFPWRDGTRKPAAAGSFAISWSAACRRVDRTINSIVRRVATSRIAAILSSAKAGHCSPAESPRWLREALLAPTTGTWLLYNSPNPSTLSCLFMPTFTPSLELALHGISNTHQSANGLVDRQISILVSTSSLPSWLLYIHNLLPL